MVKRNLKQGETQNVKFRFVILTYKNYIRFIVGKIHINV